MLETVKDIQNRRSVKSYTTEQIKDEELLEILKAGENCPTGGNRQSPIMIAVQDPEWIRKLSALNGKIAGAPEGFDVFYGAPTVVVVAADATSPDAVKDGSLCIGNMLNAAYAMGLGGRWINRADKMLEDELGKELLKTAGCEGEYVGVGCVILGYPKDGFPAPIEHKKDYYKFVR